MGKIDDLVLVILVLYPSICLANDMMMGNMINIYFKVNLSYVNTHKLLGVQPVTSLASTSSNQAVQIIQTGKIIHKAKLKLTVFIIREFTLYEENFKASFSTIYKIYSKSALNNFFSNFNRSNKATTNIWSIDTIKNRS